MKFTFLKKTSFLVIFFLVSFSENNANLEINGINYTKNAVTDYSVNGYYAGNVSAEGGGGHFFCCVSIPRKWRPGLTVTIKWSLESSDSVSEQESIVSVPNYDESDLGFFAVHFYPDNSIKVLVTTKSYLYPRYPYPAPNRRYGYY